MAFLKVSKSLMHRDHYEVRFNEDKNRNEGTFLETWIVQTDDAVVNTITPVAVASAAAGGNAVPTSGAFYTIGGKILRCSRVSPTRSQESGAVWEVQVEYTEPKTPDASSNREKWEIDIEIDGEKFQETVNKDRNGKKICNSADQAFQNQPVKTYYDEKITVSYKTNNADSETFAGLRGKVNSSTVSFTIKGESRTFNKRQMLLDEAKISTTYDGVDADTVFKVQLVLLCRTGKVKVYDETGSQKTVDNTFTTRILDQGMYRISTGSAPENKSNRGALVPILDQNSRPVTSPVPLDGTGKPNGRQANPKYLKFEIEDEGDLNQIFAGVED